MCNTRISEVMKNMEKIVWNKVLCQEVMKYGENMEKRNSDISWRKFRELYAIFKVEIKFWYCMFHKKVANAMPWNIKKTHFHPVWNIQKHKIPVDGIKVKFGAKVNSGQIKQSIKQTKIRFGKLEEIKQSNLESWRFGKLEIKQSNLEDLEIKQSNLESWRFGKLEDWKIFESCKLRKLNILKVEKLKFGKFKLKAGKWICQILA